MQKKSFLIKDILQKLNEEGGGGGESLKRGASKPDEKKVTDSNMENSQLLYDWHSLAMAAAITQQQQQTNALISPKSVFNWSKFSSLPLFPDSYLLGEQQSKLRTYFPFADSLQQSAAALEAYQKRQLNYLIDGGGGELVDVSEASNLSLCESTSSKFSECESQDAKSESSSLISIENTSDDEANSSKPNAAGGENQKNYLTSRSEEAKKRRKNRRNRTVFTELQLMGLERRFDSQKYLSTPDRAELANALGLSQLQVKTWYQNRRMKWKKQVMQGGCLVAPTKPKGRPKKGTIPSLGLTFDPSSLLSTIEARKNAAALLNNKESNPKPDGTGQFSNTHSNSLTGKSTTANQNVPPSLCSVGQLIAQHSDLAAHPFFEKVNAFGTKRTKLSFQ